MFNIVSVGVECYFIYGWLFIFSTDGFEDIYIYIYIYILKQIMEMNLTVYRKLKHKVIQKRWIYHEGKSTLKHFSFNEPSYRL